MSLLFNKRVDTKYLLELDHSFDQALIGYNKEGLEIHIHPKTKLLMDRRAGLIIGKISGCKVVKDQSVEVGELKLVPSVTVAPEPERMAEA